MDIPLFYDFYGCVRNSKTDQTVCKLVKDISDFECSLIVESPNLYRLLVECIPHVKDAELREQAYKLLEYITCNQDDGQDKKPS